MNEGHIILGIMLAMLAVPIIGALGLAYLYFFEWIFSDKESSCK